MTEIIMLTHIYSSFTNIADHFLIGDHEDLGNSSLTRYELPDGYSLDRDWGTVRDPDGYKCEIVPGPRNQPVLVSRGSRPDRTLREVGGAS